MLRESADEAAVQKQGEAAPKVGYQGEPGAYGEVAAAAHGGIPKGFASFEKVLEARPDIRVLFMSGYTDDEVMRRGVIDGQTAFLQKPFTPDLLAHKIREVLDITAPEHGSV